MRIDIKPINLEQQQVTKLTEMFIQLTPAYIRHRIAFTADEPINEDDVMCGWKAVHHDCDWRIKKEVISSIDRVYNSDKKFWKIILSVTGSNADVKLFFRQKEECERVYEIIFDYLFPAPCPTSSL